MSSDLSARATAREVLHVHVLGTPHITFGGRRVSLGSRPRLITLLALLVRRRGEAIGRDEAAFLLWPDASEAAARADLRRYLNFLDGALGAAGAESPILREGRTLRIDPSVPLRVDLLAFEDASDDDLERAVASYGPFMMGFDDDWIVAERERLHAAYVQSLERLANRAAALGDWHATLRWVGTLQRADPYREETVRTSMRAHVALGDRAAAVAAYRDFRTLLRNELDVEPMPATTALYEEIAVTPHQRGGAADAEPEYADHAVRRDMLAYAQARDRTAALRRYADFERHLARLGARPEAATASLAASLRDLSKIAAPWSARDLLPNNLPVFVTPLVGRAGDAAAIEALLATSRFVTVVGGAGLGKTRVACAVAEHLLHERHDGVFFAGLSEVTRDDAVIARVASATRTIVTPGRDPLEAIASELRDRRALLVIDNCEHVLHGAARCVEMLLRRCPQLAILATSRALLFLDSERAYDLAPLPVPGDGPEPPYAEALAIPSVALFVARYATNDRRAREVRARLSETLAICRHVDGVPLALELAACAGRHDTLRALLASLRSGDGRHETSNEAGRWRSLGEALEWSVQLLGERSRRLLEGVSPFTGTFSLDAAVAVAGANPSDVGRGLEALCDKSLLVAESVDPPAYRFLAPMREHARERLHDSGEEPAAAERYAHYFCERARAIERDFGTIPTVEWVARFSAVSADLERVLELALANTVDVSFAFALLPAMRGYWYATDPKRGLGWLDAFEERVMREGSVIERGRFLSTRGGLLGVLGNPSEARGCAERAVEYLQTCGDLRALAIALRDLGDARGILGDDDAGDAYARAAEMFRAVDDRARLASTLAQSGIWAYNRGDEREARRYYDEARVLAEDIAELRTFASATTGLGELEFSVGNVERAIELAGDGIDAFRKLGSDVGLWVTLANRSGYYLALGNVDAARADLHAAFDPLERTGSPTWLALAMQQAAAIAETIDVEAAAALLGYSAARIVALDIHREPVGERQYRELSERLGVDRAGSPLRLPFERGAALGDAEALALARATTAEGSALTLR